MRSVKYHLKRILFNVSLSYEELYTLLTQVESILNSRPLTPLTEDPDDLEPLTPGHFLIGAPLAALPEPMVDNTTHTRVTRYKHLRLLVQHFWKRWSSEYLHSLQQRSKWRIEQKTDDLVGSLVLLIEDNLPPMQWKLGRITSTHPGSDGLVRVVSVKTASGVFKRAVNKICLFPPSSGNELTLEQ